MPSSRPVVTISPPTINPEETATAASGNQPRTRAAIWRNLTDGSSSAVHVAHPNPAINKPHPWITVYGAQPKEPASASHVEPMTMVSTPTTTATQPEAPRLGVIARFSTMVAPSELLNIAV